MSSTKRIIDLQTTSSVGSDDYVMLDGATNGTKKYPLKDILDAIEDVEQGTSLAAGAVGTNALATSAVTNAKVATDAVATANIQNGAVTLAKIAAGSDATTAASGLMSSADKTKLNAFEDASHYALKSEIAGAYIYRGSVANESGLPTSNVHVGDVYNIIAASSYGGPGANVAWNGTAWDTLGETFELGDGSVTTAKLDGGAVTAAKLANGSVTTVKLDVGAVTEPKIGTGAVTTSKLGTGVVTAEKINDGAVTTTKLAASSVTTAKIVDNSVTVDKLATNAVTTAKITDGNVTAAKLDTNSVTTAKITDGAVTNAKIGSGAVTNGKLATDAVATTNVQNGAITTAKIADSAVTTAKLGVGAVTNVKVATDAITTANIQDDSVTTNKLDDGAVTFDKLDDEIIETLDFKADIDGYYAQMTVGSADNLTARGDAVEAEFMHRTSGGIADIESGNATIKSIKGNTIRWNQLVSHPYYSESTSTAQGVSFSVVDGYVTAEGTASANGSWILVRDESVPIVPGHKMLISGVDAVSGSISLRVYSSDTNTTHLSKFTAPPQIFTISTTSTKLSVYLFFTTGVVSFKGKPQLFDLTTMFGAGNEPSTVAEFEALFPLPYYPYDAGSLKPVSITGIETTGFNQWNEEWESGLFAAETGAKYPNATYIRSKNPIPCFPSTTYSATKPTAPGFHTYYYDADMGFINHAGAIGANASQVQFTTPANARYMNFCIGGTSAVTTYNHDICINLRWSGRRDGEYEEYWKAERAIAVSTYFPTGLKKAGPVYDELTGPEAITRVREVDLGTLTWTKGNALNDGTGTVFYAGLTTKAHSNEPDCECAELNPVKFTSPYENATKGVVFITGTNVVVGGDSSLSASDFKASMNGVILYAPWATPTVTPVDPPLNLTYKVDDWGTERVMVPDGTVSAVPTFDIIYGMNAVDTIRRLPDLYAGKAETEAALDTKANIDGYYQQLTAGAADNLTGRGDATGGEYLFRTTAGTASVSDEGVATVKSIKGRTLKWNQLVKDSQIHKSGTFTAGQWISTGGDSNILSLVSGHKYLLSQYGTYPLNTNSARVVCTSVTPVIIAGTLSNTQPNKRSSIFTCTDTNGYYVQAWTAANEAYDFYLNVFDLTQMFGAGNEPTTVAEFEVLYPLPYYEYDAGSMLPVNMIGVETTGFNQWDEEWEAGVISAADGTNITSTTTIRSKNHIPVFPSTEYCISIKDNTANYVVVAYDANKAYITYLKWGGTQGQKQTFTTPANCCYIRFDVNNTGSGAYGGTYKNDICINLSWSGYRNGEYEPYWSDQRLIPAGVLRGAGPMYDEQTETERIERINAITINATNGTSGITIGNTGNENLKAFIFDNAAWNRMTSNAPRPSRTLITAVTCDKLPTVGGYSGWTTPSIQLWPDGSADIIFAVGEGVSTVADLNTWLASNPLTIHYAMRDDNFVITTYDPPLNLDYRYADFGTERILVPDGEMSAPPTVEAVYGINATDTIRNLPTDYTSKKSLENLIAALDAHNGTTTTMTWNEGQQAYTFAIADNA